MNPRAPRLLVTVIVGLVAGLGLHWFFSNFDRVEREVELPPRGAARYNTLFALQHAIEGMGVEVQARPSLDLAAMALSADDLLILASDVRTFGALDVAELADFVADGGRLAFAAPDAEGGDEAPLLDALGVELVAVERCTDWHRLLMGQSSSRCATYALQPVEDGPSRIERRLGDAESGYRLLEGYYGDGQWRALSSLRPIGRRALREPEHRDLATAWILPLLPERGVVHLVFSVDVPPLYVLAPANTSRLVEFFTTAPVPLMMPPYVPSAASVTSPPPWKVAMARMRAGTSETDQNVSGPPMQ